MNIDKRSHSLININGNLIYSVGGYNTIKRYLNIVEKYISNYDKWELSSSIKLSRQDVSL